MRHILSRDHFKFWQINDNILKMVQDKHSCNGKLMGNYMWPTEWHRQQ